MHIINVCLQLQRHDFNISIRSSSVGVIKIFASKGTKESPLQPHHIDIVIESEM